MRYVPKCHETRPNDALTQYTGLRLINFTCNNILCIRETPKGVKFGKQCRPRLTAKLYGISPGSALFARIKQSEWTEMYILIW